MPNLRGHPAMDHAEHEKTYRLFLQLKKYTTAGAAPILAFWLVSAAR